MPLGLAVEKKGRLEAAMSAWVLEAVKVYVRRWR